jgi:hypothetical protein
MRLLEGQKVGIYQHTVANESIYFILLKGIGFDDCDYQGQLGRISYIMKLLEDL